MSVITTEYIQKFIRFQIIKFIPEGIDPILHIDARTEMYKVLTQLIQKRQIPLKLSMIKLVIIDYKEMLWAKYSILN
jgi:hypothetical protein